jgi:hypothetical protein
VFSRPVESYVADRKVRVFYKRQIAPWRHVDLLATNGAVHLTRDMWFDVRTWTHRNQVDLNFLNETLNHGLRCVVGARGRDWVRPLDRAQSDSIYAALKQDDSVQTRRINTLLDRRDGISSASSPHAVKGNRTG